MIIASKRNKKLEPKWKNMANSMPVAFGDLQFYSLVLSFLMNFSYLKKLSSEFFLRCASPLMVGFFSPRLQNYGVENGNITVCQIF